MNELQRQQYLQVMEVDSYFPRLQLPAAKVSELCVLPDIASLPGIANENDEVTIDVATAAIEGTDKNLTHDKKQLSNSSMAAKLLLDVDGGSTANNSAKTTSAPSQKLQPSAAERRLQQQQNAFSLAIVRSENIVIIDDALSGDVDPDRYLALLQNILFSLGCGRQALTLDAFNWPPVKARHSKLDQSESAGKEALTAYLEKQTQEQPVRCLFAMGERAARYLDCSSAKGELAQLHPLSIPAIVTQSAQQLLKEPLLKPVLWTEIQALRTVLTTS